MNRSLIFVAAVLVGQASARTIPTYSYADLFALSDLVAIAYVVAPTRDTTERFTLTDISPPTRVIGLVTEFQSSVVFKGRRRGRFTLHHYREPPYKVPPHYKGPPLVVLDPPSLQTFAKSELKAYLLFLVRERDGRFAPTAGQTDLDPSILELPSPSLP
jgi:hypothetical protein